MSTLNTTAGRHSIDSHRKDKVARALRLRKLNAILAQIGKTLQLSTVVYTK